METKKIGLEEITKMIDPIVGMRASDWYLVTAEHDGVANTLTAAWGGFGNVCEKKVATVYIRPQRHTKKFMDASGRFTMTYFDYEKYAKALVYLGSHSGADEPDKIQNAGLTLAHIDGQPTFEEGKLVLLCRTIFRQQLAPENFTDPEVAEKAFPDKDYSVMYIAEIEEAYVIS